MAFYFRGFAQEILTYTDPFCSLSNGERRIRSLEAMNSGKLPDRRSDSIIFRFTRISRVARFWAALVLESARFARRGRFVDEIIFFAFD
ncbi:MAG: hypothetical protein DWQ01_00630 [Planctomycetota bacterium]|nr:MAG: hypothetical protein DWQ01_00630 [Planctomycetota bacterium]